MEKYLDSRKIDMYWTTLNETVAPNSICIFKHYVNRCVRPTHRF